MIFWIHQMWKNNRYLGVVIITILGLYLNILCGDGIYCIIAYSEKLRIFLRSTMV